MILERSSQFPEKRLISVNGNLCLNKGSKLCKSRIKTAISEEQDGLRFRCYCISECSGLNQVCPKPGIWARLGPLNV